MICVKYLFTNRFNDVKWNGKTIVVMDDVTIEPPYQEHSCRGSEKSREHIIKIVSIYGNPKDSKHIV